MDFFKKSKPQPTQHDDLLEELDEQDAVNHNTVLDYMLELSDEDYDKLLKAAKVYREANRKVADIMGIDGVAAKAVDGEKIEVRIEKKADESSDFIETDDDTKGKNDSAKKTK